MELNRLDTEPKSLNWTREELILALDLFFRLGKSPATKNHPEVIKLSKFLVSLHIYPIEIRKQNFRNPAGICSKLSNFLCHDSDYKGVGRTNGSKLDKIVWDEFHRDESRLRRVAKLLWESALKIETLPTSIDEDEEFEEGRLLTRLHKYRERNSEVVRQKKKYALRRTGKLSCEACDFDFFEKYGEVGLEFAECHHREPISSISFIGKIRMEDLAIVCANCHRMIHRRRPVFTVEELRQVIVSRTKVQGSN